MLKVLRIILGVIIIFISAYGLITKNLEYQPFTMLFVSFMMLVMGLEEFQKGRKGYGWLGIIVSIFVFFVSNQGFY
ncbi:YczI family protein [Oceanobacillus senegalensis]|uniref:YczI family protein n=1 Tax=Oceanobacillus senegalensis TaxID=1936063 RepID=UPI000A308BA5|nr:YczI family protein [Oceanobacillus senegalensis]